MPGIPSALASLGVGHGGMAAAAAAASRLGLSGLATSGGHNVLLVSNLNPEVSTVEQFCVSVQCLKKKKIKILQRLLFTLWFMKLDPVFGPTHLPSSHHLM